MLILNTVLTMKRISYSNTRREKKINKTILAKNTSRQKNKILKFYLDEFFISKKKINDSISQKKNQELLFNFAEIQSPPNYMPN